MKINFNKYTLMYTQLKYRRYTNFSTLSKYSVLSVSYRAIQYKYLTSYIHKIMRNIYTK